MAAISEQDKFNESMAALKDEMKRGEIQTVEQKFHDHRLEQVTNTDYHIYPFLSNLCTKKIMDDSASIIQLSCCDERCQRCSVCLLTFFTQQTSYGFIKAMRKLCSDSKTTQMMNIPLRENLAQTAQYDISDFQHFEIKCPRKTCQKYLTVEDLRAVIERNL